MAPIPRRAWTMKLDPLDVMPPKSRTVIAEATRVPGRATKRVFQRRLSFKFPFSLKNQAAERAMMIAAGE